VAVVGVVGRLARCVGELARRIELIAEHALAALIRAGADRRIVVRLADQIVGAALHAHGSARSDRRVERAFDAAAVVEAELNRMRRSGRQQRHDERARAQQAAVQSTTPWLLHSHSPNFWPAVPASSNRPRPARTEKLTSTTAVCQLFST